MKDKKNLLKVATREKKFSTLAKEEALGAANRAKHTTGANKADNRMEAVVDDDFAKARAIVARTAKEKAKAKN